MKVTSIVLNSIWHDPRVRREAISCVNYGIDTTVVGVKDKQYKVEKIEELPFKTVLVEPMDSKYFRKDRTIFTIIKREYLYYQRLIKACVETKPDIIHANDLETLPIAYFASKKTKSKIVYDSHEICTDNIGEVFSKYTKVFWKIVERFLIKRVDQVVSVSNSSSEVLSKMYNIPKPLVVTNCSPKVDSKKLHQKRKDIFEVLYHGKLYEGRGYESFILAALHLKKYNSIKLVLRVLGNNEYLKKLAEEYNLIERIRFDTPVSVTELIPAASLSHIGIVIAEPINSNFINTVSNKLFEYLTAGLPVILSDNPEHRLLNSKYNFGIILENNSSECIAKAIIKLYDDQVLYAQLCENARKTVEILNWENEVKKLLNVYSKLNKQKNDIC